MGIRPIWVQILMVCVAGMISSKWATLLSFLFRNTDQLCPVLEKFEKICKKTGQGLAFRTVHWLFQNLPAEPGAGHGFLLLALCVFLPAVAGTASGFPVPGSVRIARSVPR